MISRGGEVSLHSPSNLTVYTHAVNQESFTDSSDSDDSQSIFSKGISRLNFDGNNSDPYFSDLEDHDRFPSPPPKRHTGDHGRAKSHKGKSRYSWDRDGISNHNQHRSHKHSRSKTRSPSIRDDRRHRSRDNDRRVTPSREQDAHTAKRDREQQFQKEKEEMLKAAERSKLDLLRPTGGDDHLNIPLSCYDNQLFQSIAHVDDQLVKKIERGEYVELERLLHKVKVTSLNNKLEMVNKDGHSFLVPAGDKELQVIN